MSNESSRDRGEPLGTGERLSAHIDEWVAGLNADERRINGFSITMGKKLAERIGDGVVPIGYATAIELLTYDCQTGVDGFTGAQLPSDIAGYPPMMYGLFRLSAEQFARGAFGDEFADQVNAVYADVATHPQEQTNPTQS
jgi:hypothetical protein